MRTIFFLSTLFIMCTYSSHVVASTIERELKEKQDFLTEVLIRVQMEAILNAEANQRVKDCIDPSNESEDCRIVRAQILVPFETIVAEARIHLALGHRDSIKRKNLFKLNYSLKKLGTFKDLKWDRLSAQEEDVAQGMLDEHIKTATLEAQKNNKLSSTEEVDRFIELVVREKRIAHLQHYKVLLSQIVLLQYMKDERVNRQTLNDGFTRLMDRSEKEIISISKAAIKAQEWGKNRKNCAIKVHREMTYATSVKNRSIIPDISCLVTPAILLKLLDYRAVVEGLLIEKPAYKNAYESLRKEKATRSLGFMMLTVAPVLAVCILAPPLVAVSAGAVAGGLILLDSQNAYNKVRQRELSVVVNSESDVDWESLKSARLMRNMSVVLLPFIGAGRFVSPIISKATKPVSQFVKAMTKIKYEPLKNTKIRSLQ